MCSAGRKERFYMSCLTNLPFAGIDLLLLCERGLRHHQVEIPILGGCERQSSSQGREIPQCRSCTVMSGLQSRVRKDRALPCTYNDRQPGLDGADFVASCKNGISCGFGPENPHPPVYRIVPRTDEIFVGPSEKRSSILGCSQSDVGMRTLSQSPHGEAP